MRLTDYACKTGAGRYPVEASGAHERRKRYRLTAKEFLRFNLLSSKRGWNPVRGTMQMIDYASLVGPRSATRSAAIRGSDSG